MGRLALLVCALCWVPSGVAAQDDPWLGPDKALHFGASATIAFGGYGLGVAVFDCELPRLLLGGGLSLTAGIGKELYDLAGEGDPSYRDLIWDAIGTATGLLVAWALDRLLLPDRCDCSSQRSVDARLRGPPPVLGGWSLGHRW